LGWDYASDMRPEMEMSYLKFILYNTRLRNPTLYNRLVATQRVAENRDLIEKTWLFNRYNERPKRYRGYDRIRSIEEVIDRVEAATGWYRDYYVDSWFVEFYLPGSNLAILYLLQKDFVFSSNGAAIHVTSKVTDFTKNLESAGYNVLHLCYRDSLKQAEAKILNAICAAESEAS
jgi:hypothetical protein